MSKKLHRPQRTCLGCGVKDGRDNLVRLALIAPDRLQVEPYGGRGGYLHRDPKCQKAFVNRKSHYRAFHAEVSRNVKIQFVDDLAGRD